TFGAGGGFIFNPVHNIQPNTPVENVLALYESVRDFRAYPVT
ncbi:MAG TPA: uroporphyrinogen decarboxylase family protein, partial [Chloroflexota bacterium]|nr:uroporphyrinogen decarboxylase family protein [Chloroflexota bacterium]HJO07552.1 uroporphyrinogen decarboxylase family protein [Chloroflexota bacterium]